MRVGTVSGSGSKCFDRRLLHFSGADFPTFAHGASNPRFLNDVHLSLIEVVHPLSRLRLRMVTRICPFEFTKKGRSPGFVDSTWWNLFFRPGSVLTMLHKCRAGLLDIDHHRPRGGGVMIEVCSRGMVAAPSPPPPHLPRLPPAAKMAAGGSRGRWGIMGKLPGYESVIILPPPRGRWREAWRDL